MASCSKKFCNGKLSKPVNPKEGFAVAKYKDVKAWQVLVFLVPILYSEKPIWVTIIVGNIIFGALLGEKKADWALVIRDVIKRLLVRVRKSKPSSIYLYIFHLYHYVKTMNLEDKKVYKIEETTVKHNVNSDSELELIREEDSKVESSEEIVALEA